MMDFLRFWRVLMRLDPIDAGALANQAPDRGEPQGAQAGP